MPWEKSSLPPLFKPSPRTRLPKVLALLILVLFLVYAFGGETRILRHGSSRLNQSIIRPSSKGDAKKPRVGKVHAVFGDYNAEYERALVLHEQHSIENGHPMFVLRERLLSGLWSKPAYILSIILQELTLPEDERLEWLLWLDADIVIMNPSISLDSFIPPHPEFSYVNMLVSNDRHGLNNGCFLISVNSWSVKLLSAILSFHTFRPEVQLKYSEQSAMEEMIEDRYWRKSVVKVPQVWLNAFPMNQDWDGEIEKIKPHQFHPGGLQIHFAGNRDGKRSERLKHWMDISEERLPEWNMAFEETWYAQNVSAFWEDLSTKRAAKGIEPITLEDLDVAHTSTAEEIPANVQNPTPIVENGSTS